MDHAHRWAQGEFGSADLGDERRTRRLVEIAADYARRPNGVVTRVVQNAARREGAFRFVENEAVEAGAIGEASHLATARRCVWRRELIVPVDQTSLTVTDRVGKPGFGRTGPNAGSSLSSGLQVMTAVAVGRDRVCEGILGQEWWRRGVVPLPWKQDRRSPEQRETILWRRTIEHAERVLKATAPNTRAWYQLDRGGDCANVLEFAVASQLRMTVRSAHDRKLEDGRRLHAVVRRQGVLGHFALRVRSRHGTETRDALLRVRSLEVTLQLTDVHGRRTGTVTVWCVHAKEHRTAHGRNCVEWWLLTTVPSCSFKDALNTIRTYTARWRVEDFHRAWKSGVCNVERSQLRSAAAFKRWATIGAAVAARAERLRTLSRAEPDRPALSELSRDEIDAAILLSETSKHAPGDELSLAKAVRLIADIGGYTGKSSGGPPGIRVIQRGLEEVLTAARVLQLQRRK